VSISSDFLYFLRTQEIQEINSINTNEKHQLYCEKIKFVKFEVENNDNKNTNSTGNVAMDVAGLVFSSFSSSSFRLDSGRLQDAARRRSSVSSGMARRSIGSGGSARY